MKIILSVLALSTILGGSYYIYQHNQHKIEDKAELRNRKLSDVPPQDWTKLIHTQAQVDINRRQMMKLVFQSETLPTTSKSVEATLTGFIVHQPIGIDSHVEYVKQSGQCLVIYHIGHENPGGNDAIPTSILNSGCSILKFHMPLLGQNPQPWVETKQGHYRLTSHDMLASVELPVDPLYLFMNPINQVLNKVLADIPYKRIIMAGHSGGGWATTLYAALDKRINLSIPMAGSLPLFVLATPPTAAPGDFEQHYQPLLNLVSYQDLYVMATDGGRSQLQMLSRLDDQAFAGDASSYYVEAVQSAAKQVSGTFEQYIDPDSRHHEITPNMENKIRELLK